MTIYMKWLTLFVLIGFTIILSFFWGAFVCMVSDEERPNYDDFITAIFITSISVVIVVFWFVFAWKCL